MARQSAAKRLLIAVPYLIVYVAILFPLVLVIALVLGLVDVLWQLLTGRRTRLPTITSRLWDWIGGNARYSLTGRGSFRWSP